MSTRPPAARGAIRGESRSREGLQTERRHLPSAQLLVHDDLEPQPLSQPQRLECQVVPHEGQFFAQGHDLAVLLRVERVPQQVAELFQRLLGAARIVPHEGQERVQRVEQEVRIELGRTRQVGPVCSAWAARRAHHARARAVGAGRVAQHGETP